LGLVFPATLLPLISRNIFKRNIWLLSPKSIQAVINSYLDANLVISKPGGFLYSSGHGISFFLSIYSILYAYWAGKPVYLFPQSIGPLHYRWEGIILRWMLNRVRMVMVREGISYEFINKLGIRNPRCYLIPDIAFAMPSAGRDAGEAWLQLHGVDPHSEYPFLGMTVFNWEAHDARFESQSRYESVCATTIRYFIENYNGRVILFPQSWGPLVGEDDRITALRIAELLPDINCFVTVVREPIAAELLKSLYGCMDIFIGTRLHSTIFALSEGVPVIAIGYQHKTEGVAKMVGVDKWVVDMQNIQANELIDKMKNLWEERDDWRFRIKKIIPGLVQEASRAGKLVADDYRELRSDNTNG